MHSINLRLRRLELLDTLNTLGVTRRRRFSSILPVWLSFDPEEALLSIVEDKGAVTGHVRALGEWPASGSTIDLFLLRQALNRSSGDTVSLHAVSDGVLVFGDSWQVKLNLLKFGPDSLVRGQLGDLHPLADVPLFRWAYGKDWREFQYRRLAPPPLARPPRD